MGLMECVQIIQRVESVIDTREPEFFARPFYRS
jgi:hypothetical protein